MSFKDLFDPKARAHWLRLWSNQLALLAGAIMAWVVDNQAQVLAYVDSIDQPYRSILTFTVFAVIPILLRSASQPKLAAKAAGQDQG